jgi:hypothetical protein
MKASDWLDMKIHEARREGSVMGCIAGVILGLGIMLGIHVALSMHADRIHQSAQATIREADKILSGDGRLVADVTECRDLVETVSEEKYQVVRDYQREVDRLQGVAQNGIQQGRK